MNILPRLLYMFQALPVEVPQSQFVNWDRIISRFIWGATRPRVRYETLQLPEDRGGTGLPKRREHRHAAQYRYIVCCCKPDYRAKWKGMEREFGGYPIQSIFGDKEIYKKIQEKIDPITTFTLELWFKEVKTHKIKNINQLKWVAFDHFKPNVYNKGFKLWAAKG